MIKSPFTSSKLGDLLRKVCDNLEQNFQQQNDNSMIDYVLSACINTRDKCHLCKMKEKRRRKGRAGNDWNVFPNSETGS